MNNVVSIYRGKVLGTYYSAQGKQRMPEKTFFSIGIILSMVLPAIIYCAYGGPVSPLAFAGSALAGTIWGVAKYRKSSYQILSCVKRESGTPFTAGAEAKPETQRISR